MKNLFTLIPLVTLAVYACACPAVFAQERPRNLTIHEMNELLDEAIPLDPFRAETTFKEALLRLQIHLKKKNKSLPIVIDYTAFKEDNPDAEDLNDNPVKIDTPLGTLKVRQVLWKWVAQIKTGDGAVLVKPGHLEITTQSWAQPDAQLMQPVDMRFRGRPLHLALDDLYELTGVAVVLDQRVGLFARTPITGHFTNNISLGNTLLLMSEMANLKLLVGENTIFITTPGHARQFMWERSVNPYKLPDFPTRHPGQMRRAEAAE